jgi:hypothetical protein
MKYRKKPVVVEAIQYNGMVQNVVDFVGLQNTEMDKEMKKLYIKTLEGDMLVSHGDYVIKGVNGEFYPCKPDIFVKTYDVCECEEVEESYLNHEPKKDYLRNEPCTPDESIPALGEPKSSSSYKESLYDLLELLRTLNVDYDDELRELVKERINQKLNL